ncbi:FAD/NAD(P)-binding oxidoreductase family protein [Euphorbia peplus]|nr:FAD/NAD(P)-binding oxidoreductase family protein [Euphorbia peplus]
MKKPKAVIVGGSIAGLSCAHALILAGWDVVVIEKSTSPPTGSPTGAGIGIDTLSRHIIQSWISDPQLLQDAILPMKIDQNVVSDGDEVIRILSRDESFNFAAVHWAVLHGLLYNALPVDIFLWADGCLSSIRKQFLPDLKLRYSGYCAWRGVLDFLGKESSETMKGIRKVYPELGNCNYFHLHSGTHIVLYEIPMKKLNWVWYVHQPEPVLKGNSVTQKVSLEMINKMHQEAENVWPSELVKVIKDTKEPFLNFIYDCEPLEQIVWDNVILVGDAAHPVTPNGARSTNMSILDAAVLGKCLQKWGFEKLQYALDEYQSLRLPVTSMQVLHSRRMGRIKQGLSLPDRETFDPMTATQKECEELRQRNMPYFAGSVD